MANISKIITPDGVSEYDIVAKYGRGIVRATMGSTSTNKAFVATADGISELYDGLIITLKNTVVASASGCTLNLNNLGAKRIWNSLSNAYVTTQIALNTSYIFIYDATNNRWEWQTGYNTNTDTDVRQYLSTSNTDRPLLMAYTDNEDTSNYISTYALRNNDIYANPSTGAITANNFIGKLNGRQHEWISVNDSSATGNSEIMIPDSWQPIEFYVRVQVGNQYQIYVPILIPTIALLGSASSHQIFRSGWRQDASNGGEVSIDVWHTAPNYFFKLTAAILNNANVTSTSTTKVFLKI